MIEVKAYYVPTSSVRLFSPHSYFVQEGSGSMQIDKDGCNFTFVSGKTLTFKYTVRYNLHIAYASSKDKHSSWLAGFINLPHTRQPNISKSQEDLLLLHAIFAHYDIWHVQYLLKSFGI